MRGARRTPPCRTSLTVHPAIPSPTSLSKRVPRHTKRRMCARGRVFWPCARAGAPGCGLRWIDTGGWGWEVVGQPTEGQKDDEDGAGGVRRGERGGTEQSSASRPCCDIDSRRAECQRAVRRGGACLEAATQEWLSGGDASCRGESTGRAEVRGVAPVPDQVEERERDSSPSPSESLADATSPNSSHERGGTPCRTSPLPHALRPFPRSLRLCVARFRLGVAARAIPCIPSALPLQHRPSPRLEPSSCRRAGASQDHAPLLRLFWRASRDAVALFPDAGCEIASAWPDLPCDSWQADSLAYDGVVRPLHVDGCLCARFDELAAQPVGQRLALVARHLALRHLVALVADKHDRHRVWLLVLDPPGAHMGVSRQRGRHVLLATYEI